MTDNPLHKIRNHTPRPSGILLKEKQYPTWSLSLYSKKKIQANLSEPSAACPKQRETPVRATGKFSVSIRKRGLELICYDWDP